MFSVVTGIVFWMVLGIRFCFLSVRRCSRLPFFVSEKRFVDKGDIDEHQNRSDGDADIRDVEDGKIDECEFKEIDHISAKQPVDHIADSAADDERQRKAEQKGKMAVAVEQDRKHDDGDPRQDEKAH